MVDDGLASGLDHAGADEEIPRAKVGVAHQVPILFKVTYIPLGLASCIGVRREHPASLLGYLLDPAFVQVGLVADEVSQHLFLVGAEEELAQIGDVLPGVESSFQ